MGPSIFLLITLVVVLIGIGIIFLLNAFYFYKWLEVYKKLKRERILLEKNIKKLAEVEERLKKETLAKTFDGNWPSVN